MIKINHLTITQNKIYETLYFRFKYYYQDGEKMRYYWREKVMKSTAHFRTLMGERLAGCGEKSVWQAPGLHSPTSPRRTEEKISGATSF